MKRAFTLIELLVVIAIIAILAAILFPVFAQAKEAAKKTQTLSNYKQTGTASAIYLSDSDDVMPLAFGFNTATNLWRTGSFAAVPQKWTTSGNRHISPRLEEEAIMVLNSMQPYMKNTGLFEAAGLSTFSLGAPRNPAGPAPQKVNLSYNGMLHAWNGTAIAQPAKLASFWGGHWKHNLEGLAISQPQLACTTLACQFNPGGQPSGAAAGGAPDYGYAFYGFGAGSNTQVWLYGRSMPMVFADTHAKMQNFSAPIWPSYATNNVNDNPFSSFSDDKGSVYWMTDCVAPGAAVDTMTYYPGFFRPDSEFSYQGTTSCDYGQLHG